MQCVVLSEAAVCRDALSSGHIPTHGQTRQGKGVSQWEKSMWALPTLCAKQANLAWPLFCHDDLVELSHPWEGYALQFWPVVFLRKTERKCMFQFQTRVHLVKQSTSLRFPINVEKRLTICLHWMAHGKELDQLCEFYHIGHPPPMISSTRLSMC